MLAEVRHVQQGEEPTRTGCYEVLYPRETELRHGSKKTRWWLGARGAKPASADSERIGEILPPDEGITKAYLEELHSKLYRSLQADLRDAVTEIKQDLQGLTERTTTLECKLEEALKHQSEADEEIIRLGNEIHTLRDGLEDQENRNRRQNIRIRGIPEAVLPGHLKEYLTDLFTTICGDLQQRDLEIDRAHRALGTRLEDPNRCRDVIVRLHSYSTKEKLIGACRERDCIQFREETLQVYNDLSKMTINRRKELLPLTLVMRDNGIKYKWGFPFKLIINNKGKYFTIRYPEDMDQLARALGLALPLPRATESNRVRNQDKEDLPVRSSVRLAGQRQTRDK
ncbi:hypothetical protein FKM82_017871 [Ascaphus truei]